MGRLGRQSEAKSVLRRCAGLDGKGLRDLRTHEVAKVACLFHLGRFAMEQGELQEAVDVFLEAVKIRPPFYAPQVSRAIFGYPNRIYSPGQTLTSSTQPHPIPFERQAATCQKLVFYFAELPLFLSFFPSRRH